MDSFYNSKITCTVVQILFVVGVLYGTTHPLYSEFDAEALTENDQMSDAISYLKMASGDYDVTPTHRYRLPIPKVVAEITKMLPTTTGLFHGDQMSEIDCLKRGFFIVNGILMAMTALVLFRILAKVGVQPCGQYVGVAIFLTSPVACYTTACCLVDSGYYFSVALVTLLLLLDRKIAFVLLCPLLVVFKETVLLLLLLPLFCKKGKWIALVAFAAGVVVLLLTRMYVIHAYGDAGQVNAAADFSDVVLRHLGKVTFSLRKLLTPSGIKDLLFNSVGPTLVLVPVGMWLNRKNKVLEIPIFLQFLILIVCFYALISTSFGRMTFAAFPVLIPYIVLPLLNFTVDDKAQSGTLSK